MSDGGNNLCADYKQFCTNCYSSSRVSCTLFLWEILWVHHRTVHGTCTLCQVYRAVSDTVRRTTALLQVTFTCSVPDSVSVQLVFSLKFTAFLVLLDASAICAPWPVSRICSFLTNWSEVLCQVAYFTGSMGPFSWILQGTVASGLTFQQSCVKRRRGWLYTCVGGHLLWRDALFRLSCWTRLVKCLVWQVPVVLRVSHWPTCTSRTGLDSSSLTVTLSSAQML